MKTKTKSIMTVCLAVALVAVAILGTIAYMTATSHVENTFTVGDFGYPTVDPTDSDKSIEIQGYIYEPSWVGGSKLIPGKSVAKDPYVGIDKDSDPAYVYVYIKNNVLKDGVTNKYVTFALDNGWSAVEGKAVEGDAEGTYVSGLFKYNTMLDPAAAGTDVWTSHIFEKVNVSLEATKDDFVKVDDTKAPTMTVYAFIHQAKDGEGNSLETAADAAAKTWSDSTAGN